MFSSGRVKLIPFGRHFTPEEQDTGLKKLFRKKDSMSGILNWLTEGYRPLQSEGLTVPDKVRAAIEEYKLVADIFGTFLEETTLEKQKSRLCTAKLYAHYILWAKDNGYRQMNSKDFVGELRRRCDVRKDGSVGNVVVGLGLACDNALNYSAM